MNLFWSALNPLLERVNIPLEHWQSLQNKPSLPLQLIAKTIERRAIYLEPEVPLSFTYTSDLALSVNQQLALNLATANNPLMVIQGVPGSGKTRLAQILIKSLIARQKRILILTPAPNRATYQIPSIAFSLNNGKDYRTWLTEQIKREYLGKLPMNFLPLHLLPDILLARLRSPQKLEKWLHILSANYSTEKITHLLSLEFPQVSQARLNLLAYRLQKLIPLLQQQLWLHQLGDRSEAIAAITTEIGGSIPILGTVEEFLQPHDRQLWKNFDCVIVESAENLTWSELILIAGVTNKLILLGNLPLNLSFPSRRNFTQAFPFKWLGEFLLPTYRYRLTEQFRLHSTIARPIFDVLYAQWIRTQPQPNTITLPQPRLQIIDVRGKPTDGINSWEGTRLLKFMCELGVNNAKQTGILAFSAAQKTWLQTNCPWEYRQVFIGSFADWVGREIEILLVSCVGYPEKLTAANNTIALTRASDYLIFFGDYQLWRSQPSPLQDLLYRPELIREREVSLR